MPVLNSGLRVFRGGSRKPWHVVLPAVPFRGIFAKGFTQDGGTLLRLLDGLLCRRSGMGCRTDTVPGKFVIENQARWKKRSERCEKCTGKESELWGSHIEKNFDK